MESKSEADISFIIEIKIRSKSSSFAVQGSSFFFHNYSTSQSLFRLTFEITVNLPFRSVYDMKQFFQEETTFFLIRKYGREVKPISNMSVCLDLINYMKIGYIRS